MRNLAGTASFLLAGLVSGAGLAVSPAVAPIGPAYGPGGALHAQESHVLVIEGLGGNPELERDFRDWSTRIVDASMDRFGVLPENVLYLSPDPEADPQRSTGESRTEEIEATIAELQGRVEEGDRLLIVLIGHGTFDGESARFALPGPDMSASALDAMLQGFPDGSLAVVNASSSSGPFVAELSSAGRIVVTATRNGRENNATEFGRFFTEALAGDGADVDQDGSVSILEAFTYARTEVARHYEEQNLLQTEHALLDDNGDGEGTMEPTRDTDDGGLAAVFALSPSPESLAEGDPELRALYEERLDLEQQVRDLNAVSDQMPADEYQQSLEELLLELAELNQAIGELEGGAQ